MPDWIIFTGVQLITLNNIVMIIVLIYNNTLTSEITVIAIDICG